MRGPIIGLIVAIAGFATAAMVGVAVAKTFTLSIAKNAQVTNTRGISTRENVVVDARGFAVYTLSGDSMQHPKCTKANGCFAFWPPVKVASAKALSKASGISGKLAVWHRNGFFQVTLAGTSSVHVLGRQAQACRDGRRPAQLWRHLARQQDLRNKATGTTTPGGTTTMTPTTTTATPYPPAVLTPKGLRSLTRVDQSV